MCLFLRKPCEITVEKCIIIIMRQPSGLRFGFLLVQGEGTSVVWVLK